MSIFFQDQRLSHLSKGDAYLWTKFLKKYPNNFTNIRYDVRVGKSVILPDEYPDWLKKSAEALSKKRIDVVAERGRIIYVIEIRVHAKSNVIGDLLGYTHLYKVYYKPLQSVVPMLITDTIEADLLIVLKSLKIPFFIV